MKNKVFTIISMLILCLIFADISYSCPQPQLEPYLRARPYCDFASYYRQGEAVFLDASLSYAGADGWEIDKYEWDFDYDGNFEVDYTRKKEVCEQALFTYNTTGQHTAKVRVTACNSSTSEEVTKTASCTIIVRKKVYNITQEVDYEEIQKAIDEAHDSDIIEVAPGTYNENIDFSGIEGKTLTLRSINPNDPYVVNNTVIEGDGTTSVVTFDGSGSDNAKISGFTITGGNGWDGGGIYCEDGSPVIENCVITGNCSYYYGGGIYCKDGSPVIENCVITYNYSYQYGGGIECIDGASPTIKDCFICGNQAVLGGGIEIFDDLSAACSPEIINCVIAYNLNNPPDASSNINFYNDEGSVTIENCTIYGSQTKSVVIDGDDCSIQNTIIWGNSGNQVDVKSGYPEIKFCNIYGIEGSYTDGGGNKETNSRFVDAGSVAGHDQIYGTADDGLRLRTSAESSWGGSPCVDSADGDIAPLTDITGAERIDIPNKTDEGAGTPSYVDMGAYELNRIYFVTENGTGTGESWEDPCSLQGALNDASAGEEIWVAEGTYIPGDSQGDTFEVTEEVRLYGRFAEGDTGFADRTPENQTILSGEIGDPGLEDNCGGPVLEIWDDCLVDGFIVKGGYGIIGGIGISDLKNVTVQNCFITGNEGFICGGIATLGNTGWPPVGTPSQFINCVVTDNYASNSSYDRGGGGMYFETYAELINCTITNNSADKCGGGIDLSDEAQVIRNSIIWDNYAGQEPNSIYNYGSAVLISDSDIDDSGGSGDDSWDSGIGSDGGGNIDADPVFVNAQDLDGDDDLLCTTDDGLQLDGDSPCIDAGDDSAVCKSFDITANLRKVFDSVDMGAYEFIGEYVPGSIVAMCWIDESSSYGESTFNNDLDAYQDLISFLDVTVKDGCLVPSNETHPHPITDVLPDGYSAPGDTGGISVENCDRPPTLAELIDDFDRIRDGMIPEFVVLWVDNSTSMTTDTIEPSYSQFKNWLSNTYDIELYEYEFTDERWIEEMKTGIEAAVGQ